MRNEEAELITILHLTILFGWGGVLLGTPNSRYIVISHDEWVLLHSTTPLDEVINDLDTLGIEYGRVDSLSRFDS
jgi:hypothetical protein